ncbi:MAG: hypothetical protein K2P58_13385 [Hyphomonadaceae bacterium]|nr:hypothetical protein [Hyphomonadaceae bacterium]
MRNRNSGQSLKCSSPSAPLLSELIEQRADHDFIREMLAFAAERQMGFEVDALTDAPPGCHLGCEEPGSPGAAQRVSRTVLGHARGAIDLEIPRLRAGLSPSVVP